MPQITHSCKPNVAAGFSEKPNSAMPQITHSCKPNVAAGFSEKLGYADNKQSPWALSMWMATVALVITGID